PVRATTHRREDGRRQAIITVPRLPTVGTAPGLADVAATLGLRPDELVAPPVAYEAGVPFTIVRVADRDSLIRVRLDSARWAATFGDAWAPQLYVIFMQDWQRG